jgi:hypothetical protein
VAPARAIVAVVVNRKVGKLRRLFVRVSFADTGELKSQFRSPFQRPAFAGIVASVIDTNGDGVGDSVVLKARKGRKIIQRSFPG